MLIVMSGLPATGKTTLAKALAERLDAVVVSKDDLRRAAFAPDVLDYSDAQNDLCMEMVYRAVEYIVRAWPGKHVIVDGRTYSQKAHVERLVRVANGLRIAPHFIECTCSDRAARERLENAPADRPADRDFSRYLALKERSDPLNVRRLTLDTGTVDVREAVRRCVAYLTEARCEKPRGRRAAGE